MKPAYVLNVLLFVVALLLALNLLQPLSSITGALSYQLDADEPLCTFHDNGELHDIPQEQCCYQLLKQYTCTEHDQDEYNVKCFTAEDSPRYFLTNNKMVSYCQKEGYDVEVD